MSTQLDHLAINTIRTLSMHAVQQANSGYPGTPMAAEQSSKLGWGRYVGESGRVIGMKKFGATAPLKELQRKFGFEPEGVVAAATE